MKNVQKTFQAEINRSNRRKGFENLPWGVLGDGNQRGYFACWPRSPGSWRRHHIGGPFETPEEARLCVAAMMRGEKVDSPPPPPQRQKATPGYHLDGHGEACFCPRGALFVVQEISVRG